MFRSQTRRMATDISRPRSWLLLPGTLCTGTVFDGFLDALNVPQQARQVILLDRPAVSDYLQEMKAMSNADTVVCGFSLGAIVAAHLADQLPASQFLLFGLNPHADDPAKRDGRLALCQDVHQRGGASALASRLPPLAGNDPEHARAIRVSMAEATGELVDAQTALALSRPGALPSLARTQAPVSLLTGTCDAQAPLDLVRDAADVSSHVSLIRLPDLGHYALLEDPDACSRLVEPLLI